MAVFEDRILVDPTAEEETLAWSVVTVVLDESADSAAEVLCQMQKSGGRPISREKMQECTAMAKKQAKKIAKMMDAAAPAEENMF
jgi:exosome complex RNA-binding protein Rrp42 (RNase PH superfamily)